VRRAFERLDRDRPAVGVAQHPVLDLHPPALTRGRVQVEADDVADFRFELGIGGELEGPLPPWLHSVGTPRPGDGRVGDPEMPAEQPRGPVRDREGLGWRIQGRGDDLRVVDRLRATATREVRQPRHTIGGELITPLDHRRA
jgi:hypothetical protein